MRRAGAELRRFPTPGAAATLAVVLFVVLVGARPAAAQTPGAPVTPIPTDPVAGEVPEFIGSPAEREKVRQRWRPVQNPFMAPDPFNNLHNDAYMTDTYRRAGPLGREMEVSSNLFVRECASITFDSRGRIVTVCVGLDRPVLALLDPVTLEVLAAHPLPPREESGDDPFTSFAGGGYFYLDGRDRAVVPAATRHLLVIGQTEAPGFEVLADHDLSAHVAAGDGIVSALPDHRGRIWFASTAGVVGWVSPRTGAVRSRELGEPIHNSFAVDETGGVFIVTDAALYRFEARRRRVKTVWRRTYPNTGEQKPGQTQAGSGTTPTLIGRGRVAIADNADPINVVVYRRGRKADGRRKVCSEPVFTRGASATDQSLVAAGRGIVAENNYGYTGPAATQGGETTTAGLQRVNVRRGKCRTVWRSEETAPSVVPKASLRAGLVYTYTKPESPDGDDAWYLTALDFRTGETEFKRLAGVGLGYNNNWAPVTIGPDGAAYLGVLGGITRFADTG